jgi:nucleotide-binding universal stress UspA family protein
VALDGSEPSKRAFEMALSLAGKYGAKLLCLNVFTPPYLPPEPYASGAATLMESLRLYGEDLVRTAASEAKDKDVVAEWMVSSGAPAEMIVDAAVAVNADLVLVGNRGQGAVKRALLGSVSSRLSHICDRPLLIVH